MRRILVIIALFFSCQAFAQTDTAFWFAPPDLSDSNDSTSIRLVFHSYDQPATVTVEQPASGYFPTTSILLHPYDTDTINLSAMVDSIETKPVNTVLNRGFYIHSTAPITCYYQSTSNNRETYTLKGRHALGTEFQILTPIEYQPKSLYRFGQSIEIIATEDSTLVTIVPNSDSYTVFVGGITSDSTLQIRLNRGQSYALRGYDHWTKFIKTKIHSSKPIAVNVTSDRTMSRDRSNIGIPKTYNLAGEQLVPLCYWGTQYVRINGLTTSEGFRGTDYFDNGTYTIRQNGTQTGILGGGSVWNTGWSNLFDSVSLVDSERPIGFVHQIDPNLQMGATILPHLECSGSNEIAYLHSDNLPLFIYMIIDSSAIDDLSFNWNATILTPSLFHPIPGMPSKMYCNTRVDQYLTSSNGNVMHISCSSSKFILAVIESDSIRGTSYTYLTDYAPYTDLALEMDTNEFCSGDSIIFNLRTYNIDSIAIHGPNDFLLTEAPFVIPYADLAMTGTFVIEGFSNIGCVHSDTVEIIVNQSPTVIEYDTIYESQLPWHRYGIEFKKNTDTTFHRTDTLGFCDSLFHYHLRIISIGSDHDTLIYYVCPNEMPLKFDTLWIYGDTICDFHYTGIYGQDSTITLVLHVLENTDTSIFDTIVNTQLPWTFMGIPFEDSVSNYLFITTNEQGCDSTIHYNLFIYWNGDHCDTTLTYPNFVTPNGDGSNDKFVIEGLLENNCFKYNDLSIYDRTGNRVYHKTNIANEDDWWDPAAERTPSGTYFYYFKAHGVNIHTQHKGVIEVLHEK